MGLVRLRLVGERDFGLLGGDLEFGLLGEDLDVSLLSWRVRRSSVSSNFLKRVSVAEGLWSIETWAA